MEYSASAIMDSQHFMAFCFDLHVSLIAFQIVSLYFAYYEFPLALYGVALLVGIPLLWRTFCVCVDINPEPLSLWTYAGYSNVENIDDNDFIIHDLDTSLHGIANDYLLYSSTTVRKYSFCVLEGSGPLKSMLNLSNGWVAFINLL